MAENAPSDPGGADPLVMVQQELAWVSSLYETAIDFVVSYAFDIVGAVLVLVAGIVVANWLSRTTLRLLEKRSIDVTLRQFVAGVVRLLVLVLVIIVVLGKVGVEMTPFVAAIGGLAVGLSFAVQGPVSNYGAGLVIILTRPFKVGDTIRVLGQAGIVEDINLATTILITEDGEHIVIPNKHVVGEVLVNSRAWRVVEGTVGIAYADVPETAIRIIEEVLAADVDVTSEPPPQVGIAAFDDSAVRIDFRYWVPTERFFAVQYRINLAVWNALSEGGVSIPFPQREVLLTQR